jgi:hypothetical protein
MKALVRSIVMVAILIPFAVNAAPAKKPGKKGGPNYMEMESGKQKKQGKEGKKGKTFKGKKHGKQGKQGIAFYGKKKGKKGKSYHAQKQAARRAAAARERRRQEARRRAIEERRIERLLAGFHVAYADYGTVSFHVVSNRKLRRILRKLDRARGPMMKLDILAHAASQRYFTSGQGRMLLREFRSQKVRLEALKVLRTRIVDRQNFHKLVRAFEGRKARRRAALMLAQL